MQELLAASVELNVVDGVILPNLKMQGAEGSLCVSGRRGSMQYSPVPSGICRLFPLGEDIMKMEDFPFSPDRGMCKRENRSKIKVSKWIDTPDLTRNQQFTLQWHDLLHAMEERLTGEDEGKQREENLLLLRLFYLLPYEGTIDFYTQFTERMEHWNWDRTDRFNSLNKLSIEKRLLKVFRKTTILLSMTGVIACVAMGIVSYQYSYALKHYGFAQGDIGKGDDRYRGDAE